MKTNFVDTKQIERKWFIFDAADKTLGRFSTEIAKMLRGKNKPSFSPNHDNGDFVIIINAEKVNLTGTKLADKKYYSHSRYPGGLKEETAGNLLGRKPENVILHSIAGMIPRNRLKKEVLSKLKIYKGSEHPHEAQKPIKLEL
jgi:large subunit ribosomal protein L13